MAGQRMRRRGSHLPAGLRRAGHGRSIDAQQQQRYARSLGSQGKTATSGKIQFAQRTPAFHDHRSQRRAAQGIDGGAQQRHRAGHHGHQPIPRRTAQFGPAIGLHHAAQPDVALCPQPQHRAARARHSCRYRHGKSRRGRRIVHFGRIDFMNAPARQPTSQSGVERGDAERPARRGQRHRAFAHGDWSDSHMFLLCSTY